MQDEQVHYGMISMTHPPAKKCFHGSTFFLPFTSKPLPPLPPALTPTFCWARLSGPGVRADGERPEGEVELEVEGERGVERDMLVDRVDVVGKRGVLWMRVVFREMASFLLSSS